MRLKRHSVLTVEQFKQHPVISFSTRESGLTMAFENWVGAHDVKIRNVLSCNSLTAIIALTVAGLGISFLPRHYVQPLVRRRRLVALRSDPPLPSVTYSFIWRRDDHRPLVGTFRRLLLESVNFRQQNPLWDAA